MRMIKLKAFYFTPKEIEWLSTHSIANELAADILSRYYQKHGRRPRIVRGLDRLR